MSFDMNNPSHVGMGFAISLDDPTMEPRDLALFVTPESLAAWGDFSSARDLYLSIEDPAFASGGQRATNDDDVHYVAIMRGVKEGYQNTGGEALVDAAAILTLVWRPSFGRWMVHAIGDYVHPSEIPRG